MLVRPPAQIAVAASAARRLIVRGEQVQNLTPQLVNAGTIKMTYPENKVGTVCHC